MNSNRRFEITLYATPLFFLADTYTHSLTTPYYYATKCAHFWHFKFIHKYDSNSFINIFFAVLGRWWWCCCCCWCFFFIHTITTHMQFNGRRLALIYVCECVWIAIETAHDFIHWNHMWIHTLLTHTWVVDLVRMDEWMNEWMAERSNKWNVWMNEWMNEHMDGWLNRIRWNVLD